MDAQRNEHLGDDHTGAGSGPGTPGSAGSSSEASASAGDGRAPTGNDNVPARGEAAKPISGSGPRGTVTIMAPEPKDWYRHWDDEIEVEAPDAPHDSAAPRYGKSKLAAVAAIVILAAFAGAIGGAVATAGFARFGDAVFGRSTTVAKTEADGLGAQVAQIQAEVAGLKASVEHANKMSVAQLGKATDRLEKLEKAQAEPAAKIAKLTETVDKLRTAQAQPPAPATTTTTVASAAPTDVTGSIAPKAEAPKSQPGRLPTVDGWVLRDVYDGGAVIEGRGGTYEVYAGDPVPGLGRVDAIRRQDGRWVVVTSRGLIVAR